MTASTVAHEIGHNFGLSHNSGHGDDEDSCECQESDGCVMDAYASIIAPVKFNECQQQNLRAALDSGSMMCLHNDPLLQLDDPICGDYLVNDEGEQCDCGPSMSCEDPCCNARDCTLKSYATCSSMDLCCDPSTCSVIKAGHVCRSKVNDCDIEETCDGVSSECPTNMYFQDGIECSVGKYTGHCFLGECKSAEHQCSILFAEEELDDQTEPQCWSLNQDGDWGGHCDMSSSGEYEACTAANQRCGKLQCSSHFGLLDYNGYYPSPNFYSAVSIGSFDSFICTSHDEFHFMHDLADDLSYVKDGTWCDENKFCYRRQCLHVAEIPGVSLCPHNCYGNGVCDWRTRECECRRDFTGVFCNEPKRHSAKPLTLILTLAGAGAIMIFVIASISIFVAKRKCKAGASPEKANPII